MKPFDDRAHLIVAEMIDATEEFALRNGRCVSEYASMYVCIQYIERCAGVLQNAHCYLENDAKLGAVLFLDDIAREVKTPALLKRRYRRYDTQCAQHLVDNVQDYFRSFKMLMRKCYLYMLNTCDDARLSRGNGHLMLAAAMLPGVRTDIRRALRERGLGDVEALLVPDWLLPDRPAMLPARTANRRLKNGRV
jgi:hypothetical protein